MPGMFQACLETVRAPLKLGEPSILSQKSPTLNSHICPQPFKSFLISQNQVAGIFTA